MKQKKSENDGVLVPGRYSMSVYPCGCSIGRVTLTGVVTSVGFCDEHLERARPVELDILGAVIGALAPASGAAMVVDTVQLGEDFVEYMRDRSDEDEATGEDAASELEGAVVDGRA